VIPVVMYGSETWSVNGIDMKKTIQVIWRKRTNQELSELYKHLYITAYIQNKRLERNGKLVRIDQDI